jgi:hypothetical protein
LSTDAEPLKKTGRRTRWVKKIFAIALNIGFFLCYFRRRVEFVGKCCPRQNPAGDFYYGEKECSAD